MEPTRLRIHDEGGRALCRVAYQPTLGRLRNETLTTPSRGRRGSICSYETRVVHLAHVTHRPFRGAQTVTGETRVSLRTAQANTVTTGSPRRIFPRASHPVKQGSHLRPPREIAGHSCRFGGTLPASQLHRAPFHQIVHARRSGRHETKPLIQVAGGVVHFDVDSDDLSR